MQNKKYVAYYRVSTSRQGQSGLGLEAQKEAVGRYLSNDASAIAAEYVEVESGKKANRPKLLEALAVCKRLQATLIIAKLDRLARNVHFISGLMESGAEFVAVDNPNANKLMLHMLAAFAEYEREQISQRTKSALAAAKARGVKLGKNGRQLARQNHAKAVAFAESLRPIITALIAEGYTTTRAICEQLNLRNIPTASGEAGRKWHLPQVHGTLKYILC